jgi:succinoglycan biosynthesis protein ExoA
MPIQRSATVRISVVIPCRNEIRHIRPFLDSLVHQDVGQIEMEILIADGMSTDGTRLILREFEKRFSIVRSLDNPERIASTGLNRAIRESQGEIILRMDVHTVYAPNYLRSCIEVLCETSAENVGGPAMTRADGYVAQAIAHAFHVPFATGGAKYRDPHYEGPVRTVPYGCWRKSTLERIGLFDEDLVRGQDDELNFRIVSSGGTVWQSPRIMSWYRPRTSLPALFRQYFQNGFWKVAIIRKHGRPASWRNLVPVLCLLVFIVLLLCTVAASIDGSARGRNAFLSGLLVLAGSYFIASFAAALSVARRMGWMFFLLLPVVFATYQLSYAIGFLLALFYRPARRNVPSRTQEVMTPITK